MIGALGHGGPAQVMNTCQAGFASLESAQGGLEGREAFCYVVVMGPEDKNNSLGSGFHWTLGVHERNVTEQQLCLQVWRPERIARAF